MKRSLAFVLVVAGCGSDISTAGVDSYIAARAQHTCAWYYKCCKDPEILALEGRRFTDQARCEDYKELEMINDLYLNRLAVGEGRLRLDNARVTACLAQQAARACTPMPGQPAPAPNLTDACLNVFIGATPIGRECIYTNECVEGARCVEDELAVGRGVCVPYQRPGDICNKDADCDPRIPQLYCAAKDFTCRLRGQLGEPCEFTLSSGGQAQLPMLLECDPTTRKLYCDPIARTCKNLPQNGQPCLNPNPPGVSNECDPDPTLDLTCDTSSTTAGICRAPGKLGDDCSRIACGTDLYCDRTGATDVCRARPTLSQDCDFSIPCKEPYFCNTNTFPSVCAQPARLNEDCSTVTCDTGLYCEQMTTTRICRPKRPDGALCTASDQCLSADCGFANPRVCEPRTFGLSCTGR